MATRIPIPGKGRERVGGDARFLFYSHDSWGLGHLRRSLTLAEALTRAVPGSSALVATGSPCATHFPLPSGVDVLKLPAVTKNARGRYQPRTLGGELEALLALRGRLLLEASRAFAPDVLIVDHQVSGLGGEMLPLLREARERGVFRLLGLRDVIDSPEAVARGWANPEARWALEHGYDSLCVYGSPEVFDPREHYPLPASVRDRLWFSGYVVREPRAASRRPVPSLRPRVLVTLGGGEDGADKVERYFDALALGTVGWDTTVVGGPLMNSKRLRDLKYRARSLGNVEVRRFHSDLPSLFREASAIVAMAGYNTSAEILQSGRPVIFLPRTHPRREQQIRAESLERLGLAASLVDPTPDQLRDTVERAVFSTTGARAAVPDLQGSRRVSEAVLAILGGNAAPLRAHAR